jgi:hypothetical protein
VKGGGSAVGVVGGKRAAMGGSGVQADAVDAARKSSKTRCICCWH